MTISFMSSGHITPSQNIGYGFGTLYFLDGLSFGCIAKVLYFLYLVKLSHVSTWNWIQKVLSKEIIKQEKEN